LRERIAHAVGGGGGGAVHGVLRRGGASDRHERERLRLPRDGLSGCRPERLPRLQLRQEARDRAHQEGRAPVSPEQVDVCIVGSGFGGAISAWRLAELYRAAGVDPARILVLERGRRYKHTDFKQSMYVGHLSDIYLLIQSSGGPGTFMAGGPTGGPVV